jgi:predicted nuclease with RNAse H fold
MPPPQPLVVAGIDVGGKRKGFHAVALRDGAYLDQMKSRNAAEIAAWCRDTGARFIGIDAPCRWSADGRARPAERELMEKKIWCFSTPTLAAANAHPKGHYDWMLVGAELFHCLELDYPLFGGRAVDPEKPASFETFPHAITCALRGAVASAKSKRKDRSALLEAARINLPPRAVMDTIDAALCALVAARFAANSIDYFGNAESGFIVLPR